MTSGALLERRRIFHSQDTEETRNFLNGKDYLCEFDLREPGALDTRINGIYSPDRFIGYVQYGAVPVEVGLAGLHDSYALQIPLRGNLVFRVGRQQIACDSARAAVSSPSHDARQVLSHPGSARIQVSVPARSMLDGLATLMGEPPQQRPELAPSLDLSAGYGRSLASYILMAALDLDRPDSVLLHSRAMEQFEQLIVTTLLLSHEHSCSEQLRRCARAIAPKDVKRTLDFIESNLAAPVSLAGLVAVSGVPGRTLLKHFRDTKGVSPMRYLRNKRFARVREALLAACDEDRVTEIALACGFSHMGRFSVEYRRRFGESPSETLKRRAPRCS